MLVRRIVSLLFSIGFILVLSASLYSQNPEKLISTLSQGAASKTISTDGKIRRVPQSIGQASVIGLFTANKLRLQQGFLQPVKFGGPSFVFGRATMKGSIYPNPFTGMIVITLENEAGENLDISLTDMQGRLVYNQNFTYTKHLNLNLHSVQPGIYLIKIKDGNRQMVKKVMKSDK